MNIESLYNIYKQYPNISTDTRKIEKDCLFFALKGANFDGNSFAEEALSSGAAYSIADNQELKDKNPKIIVVKDVLETLQALARFHRQQFDIPIIAVTGSNGKTTTKELINEVLSNQYPTHCTKGNLNNHIGVPLTLLQMKDETEVAVIEMGANHQHEIELLCDIACPTHGVITNVGKAHLEGFGGFEGVKKGKSEMYRYLAQYKGLAFINKDEPSLCDLAIGAGIERMISYQKSDKPDAQTKSYEVILMNAEPFLKVGFLNSKNELLEVNSHLIGTYNFGNIATAIAIGRYFKVPSVKIKQAIENYIPSNNRSQLSVMNGFQVIMDAYNANPTSMRNAIQNFAQLKNTPKIPIIGDMFELGASSKEEHKNIAQLLATLKFEQTILVGENFKPFSKKKNFLHFPNVQALKTWFLAQNFDKNTTFLLKGSRGMRLEELFK